MYTVRNYETLSPSVCELTAPFRVFVASNLHLCWLISTSYFAGLFYIFILLHI